MLNPRPRHCFVLPVLALAAVALVLSACSSTAPTTRRPSLEVDVAEAAALRADGALMLDVREPSEWASGHIPDATLIPLGQLEARVAEVPTDRIVVVVCRSGNRSAQGRDILLQAGRATVTSMAGGMNDWTAAGLPTVAGP